MHKKKSVENRPCVVTYTRLFLNWVPFFKLGVQSSDMFDWNDEAIASIIWGEAGESGDHIVPYPDREEEDGHRKFQNQEPLYNKPAEHKLSGGQLDFRRIRPESSPASNKNGQISASGTESWPNMATSEVAETDHSSLNDRMFSDSVLISKYSSKDECQFDGDSGAYVNHQCKELSDFGEYGWDNIGSFDDLDRIFSSDEPLFSSGTLGNPDDIWSSSKQNKKSPPKSFDSPIEDSKSFLETSEAVQVKSKYERSGQSIDLSFEAMDDAASLTFQQKNEMPDIAGDGEDERKHNLAVEVKTRPASSHLAAENILTLNEFADKVYGKESHLKVQKKTRGKAKGKSSQRFNSGCSLPSNTFGFYKHQLSASLPQACLSSSLSQLNHVEGPETLNYQLIPHSCMTPSAFANYANPIASMHPSVCYQPGELKCQTFFPGYEVTSNDVDFGGKQLDSPGKVPHMTPREKIEKLRRRQQMQAMLAIQNQLQQFGNQISPNDITRKSSPESLNQLKPGPSFEVDNLSALPSLDIASSIEQDESSTLSAAADGYSIEEEVLQRLQDVISKLDVPIRISIRDSLLRLATSALQRQKITDVSSSSLQTRDLHEAVGIEEHDDSKREVKVTNSETDTNPIDRAVAHLLFHRPMDLTVKHPETPESSMSAKLNMERQAHSGANQAVASRRSSKISLDFSSHRVGNRCQQHADCMDRSHPPSDYSALAGGASRRPDHCLRAVPEACAVDAEVVTTFCHEDSHGNVNGCSWIWSI